MFVYTKDSVGNILTVAEKDILAENTYYAKFEYEGQRPDGPLEHYTFDGTDFVLKPADEITAIETEKEAQKVKQKRDKLINEVLWMLDRHRNQKEFGLPTTLTDTQAAEIAQYIQDLRDVPQQTGFPFDVVWPTKPQI